MGLFNDILKDNESVFLNPVVLDYDYIPKLVTYRESEQRRIAGCVKPLFQNRNGKNILIYGPPGIGKTVACRHVLNEVEEHTDDVVPLYINCWQKNTTYKIVQHICEELGYGLTHNKKTEELFSVIKQILNKKSAVFLFDEVDKLVEMDFIYMVLEEIYRKSIIMVTNYRDWFNSVEDRIKSRLTPEFMEFKAYNADETKGILKDRAKYAFVPSVWDDEAFEFAVAKTISIRDIRSGLYLLRESGNQAEEKVSKKIKRDHVDEAVKKLNEFTINEEEVLEEEVKAFLEIVKTNSGLKIGGLYEVYQNQGGKRSYKHVQRMVKKLQEGKYVRIERLKGSGGNTSVVNFCGDEVKRLSDF